MEKVNTWVPIGCIECPHCKQIHRVDEFNLYYNCQTTSVDCWACKQTFKVTLHANDIMSYLSKTYEN